MNASLFNLLLLLYRYGNQIIYGDTVNTNNVTDLVDDTILLTAISFFEKRCVVDLYQNLLINYPKFTIVNWLSNAQM